MATSGKYVADKVLARLFTADLPLAALVRLDNLLRSPVVSFEVLESVDDIEAGESVGAGAR